MDVAEREGTWGADAVDQELTRLIEKRSSMEVDPDEIEQGYVESVRRYNARQQEENRQAWREHHQRQAACLRATLEALIARHEEQAAKLMDTSERKTA